MTRIKKKKFSRVVIHAGTGKTGSTYLQRTFHSGRSKLLDAGSIAYPTCVTGNWHHGELGTAFCSEPKSYLHNIVLGIQDNDILKIRGQNALEHTREWINQVNHCQTLLFSFEGYIQLDQEAWSRFRDFCLEYSDNVEIVVYCRPPIALAISALSQCIKQGIDTTVGGYYNVIPYKDLLEPLMGIFGKEGIIVKAFHTDALLKGDLLFDFLNALNQEKEHQSLLCYLPNENDKNASLSREGAKVGTAIISHLIAQGVLYNQSWFYHKIGRKLSSIPGSKLRLPPEQLTLVENLSEAHNVFLQEEFGVSLQRNN